jgi:Protein of unknown function (DUF4236)
VLGGWQSVAATPHLNATPDALNAVHQFLAVSKLNFSKSGVGYSAGGRGFRVGKDAKGRTYTAASISLTKVSLQGEN